MKTLLLNKEDVQRLIEMKDVIPAVEAGYKAFCSGQVIQPGYMSVHLPAPRGEIDFKAGYCSANEAISIKASSGGFSENPTKYGLPSGMGTILLFDGVTCALTCIMDGSLITGLRTGAAGAVSVKLLARKDAGVLTCVGTGKQARMQIRAISQVMHIEEICAWNRSESGAQRFKDDIEAELGIPVRLCSREQEAVSAGDIVITTTRGAGPVVEAGWVKPGTHIIAIGTDVRGKQEWDPEIFRGAKIVCDSIEQCVEKGETWHPIHQGIIKKEEIHGEIGELLLGKKPGRENNSEITIFDSTGMAIQDNFTAFQIYQNACNQGVGTSFEFF